MSWLARAASASVTAWKSYSGTTAFQYAGPGAGVCGSGGRAANLPLLDFAGDVYLADAGALAALSVGGSAQWSRGISPPAPCPGYVIAPAATSLGTLASGFGGTGEVFTWFPDGTPEATITLTAGGGGAGDIYAPLAPLGVAGNRLLYVARRYYDAGTAGAAPTTDVAVIAVDQRSGSVDRLGRNFTRSLPLAGTPPGAPACLPLRRAGTQAPLTPSSYVEVVSVVGPAVAADGSSVVIALSCGGVAVVTALDVVSGAVTWSRVLASAAVVALLQDPIAEAQRAFALPSAPALWLQIAGQLVLLDRATGSTLANESLGERVSAPSDGSAWLLFSASNASSGAAAAATAVVFDVRAPPPAPVFAACVSAAAAVCPGGSSARHAVVGLVVARDGAPASLRYCLPTPALAAGEAGCSPTVGQPAVVVSSATGSGTALVALTSEGVAFALA